MLDWARVDELRDEIGEADFAEVVELFLDEVESTLMRLVEGAASGRLEEDMHFLKGGAWNLGFHDFGALCAEGEKLASAGRAAEVSLTAVQLTYAASKRAFMDGLAQRSYRQAGSAA